MATGTAMQEALAASVASSIAPPVDSPTAQPLKGPSARLMGGATSPNATSPALNRRIVVLRPTMRPMTSMKRPSRPWNGTMMSPLSLARPGAPVTRPITKAPVSSTTEPLSNTARSTCGSSSTAAPVLLLRPASQSPARIAGNSITATLAAM